MQLALPEFSGVTRRLILWNLGAYFTWLLLGVVSAGTANAALLHLGLFPPGLVHGELWQVATYSLIHLSLVSTLFELLTIWFVGGLLENLHGGQWLLGLYGAGVVGTAVAAALVYLLGGLFGMASIAGLLTGAMGAIFAMLVATGLLHGEMEFLLFFVISIKAKYLAAIYMLIALASLFGEQRFYAFAQLGAALAAWLYIRLAPRRGFSFAASEGWYGLRNRYYRWKRRRAARKFQVYMRKQGRTMRFDSRGNYVEDDDDQNTHDDPRRWN